VTPDHLYAAFGHFGEMENASVSRDPSPRGLMHGFVRFKSTHSAAAAVKAAENATVMVGGSPCVAKWAKADSKLHVA
jgi:hypothetical protein